MFSVPLEQLASVTARMAYTEASERAHIRVYPPSSGKKMDAPRRERHDKPVYDMRTVVHEPEVDVAGFSLARAPTQFADFFDSNAVKQDYYPDVVEVLKKHLGALEVFVFDHNVRSNSAHLRGRAVFENLSTALTTTTRWLQAHVVSEVLENIALHLSEHRARSSTSGAPYAARAGPSIGYLRRADNLHQGFHTHRDRHYSEDDFTTPSLTGEVYSFSHSEEHRWFYASDMQPDEVLLKQPSAFHRPYRFQEPGVSRRLLATESIEACTVVIYPNSD